MSTVLPFLFALVAAGVAALQAPINSALARRIGLMAANVFSNIMGTVALVIAMAVMEPKALRLQYWVSNLGKIPPILWIGGILGSLYMVASVLTVQRIGAVGWVIAAFAGQIITGLLVDKIGLFGVRPVAITWTHLAGVGLILVGGLLATRR